MKIRMEFDKEETAILSNLLDNDNIDLKKCNRIINIISDNGISEYNDGVFMLEHDIKSSFIIDLFQLIKTNFKSIKSIVKNLNVSFKPLTSKWFETKDLSEYNKMIKENNYHYIIEFRNDTVEFTHDIYYVFHILKNTPNVKFNVLCIYDIKSEKDITKEVLYLL